MSRRPVKFASEPKRYKSLRRFLLAFDIPSGNLEIQLPGQPIHVLWSGRKYAHTLVTFSGTINHKVEYLPAYAGISLAKSLPVNRIHISDPTLVLDTNLRLSWYAGNELNPALQQQIARIIQKLAGKTSITLFGPSGGGFAALAIAPMLRRNVRVLVSNPQTDIQAFTEVHVKKYLDLAWNGVPLSRIANEGVTTSVLPIYAEPNKIDVIYLQNTQDLDHVERHAKPFREAIHPDNRIIYLEGAFGEGHRGPSRQSFVDLLLPIVSERTWEELEEILPTIQLRAREDNPEYL